MAFRYAGIRVERRPTVIFAQGTVEDTETELNPANCGETADPPCCGPDYTQFLSIAAEGPLEFFFSPVTLDWVMDWDGERQSWAGSVTDGSVEIRSELWCNEDPELGQTWWLSGSYQTASGDLVPYLVSGSDYDDVLVFEVEISGTEQTLLLVTEHPCPVSGGSNSSGIMCPGSCGLVVATVTDETGDCTCLPATLSYGGPLPGVLAYWTTSSCPGNITYELRCVGGEFEFSLASGGPGIEGHICELVSSTASPLSLTYQLPDLGANCGTSGTAKVTLTCV